MTQQSSDLVEEAFTRIFGKEAVERATQREAEAQDRFNQLKTAVGDLVSQFEEDLDMVDRDVQIAVVSFLYAKVIVKSITIGSGHHPMAWLKEGNKQLKGLIDHELGVRLLGADHEESSPSGEGAI